MKDLTSRGLGGSDKVNILNFNTTNAAGSKSVEETQFNMASAVKNLYHSDSSYVTSDPGTLPQSYIRYGFDPSKYTDIKIAKFDRVVDSPKLPALKFAYTPEEARIEAASDAKAQMATSLD